MYEIKKALTYEHMKQRRILIKSLRVKLKLPATGIVC